MLYFSKTVYFFYLSTERVRSCSSIFILNLVFSLKNWKYFGPILFVLFRTRFFSGLLASRILHYFPKHVFEFLYPLTSSPFWFRNVSLLLSVGILYLHSGSIILPHLYAFIPLSPFFNKLASFLRHSLRC